ncbi:Major Facilitator Superfamily protein [compost metagenome]
MLPDHYRHRQQAQKSAGYFEGRAASPESDDARHPKSKGRLNVQAILLLVVSGLFAAANALSGTFVGVYLWKAKNDFVLIGWYTLAIHVTMAVTFWLAGKWVKEHNKMNCLRVGIMISATFYMLVLWLGSNSINYVLILGAVQGVAAGLFWIAFNVVYFEVTDPDNRDNFNGWAGLLGSGAGIIAPWISGILIVRMAGASGYRLIFSISLGIYLVGVIVSFFLKKRKVAGTYEWLFPRDCLKQKDTPWRSVSLALIAQGLREGVFGFMIGLLVYISTASEAGLGSFVLITSSVAFVSYWVAGKWLKPQYRKKAMLLGATMMVIVIVPFFWKINMTSLFIFGIGISIFMPLYMIPMVSSVFDLIGGSEQSARKREEYVVLRELCLNLGRILGTLLFIIVVSWSTAPIVMSSLLLVIGSSSIISWVFMRKQLPSSSPTP